MIKEKLFENGYLVFLISTISCLLWGSAFPSLKISYQLLEISNTYYAYKLLFAGYRFFIASIFIFLFLFLNKESLKLNSSETKNLMFLGLLQTSFQYFFFYIGLSNSTGIKGSIIGATGTFFAVILSHFYYHNDKLSLNKVIGLIIGFCGVLLINLSKGHLDFNITITGEIFLVLAALFSSVSSIFAKNLSKSINPVKITAYQMFFGSIVLLLLSSFEVGLFSLNFSKTTILLLLYLSFLSATAFTLWYQLLKHNSVSTISIYKFQIPIFGTILSSLFLKSEGMSFNVLISLLFVSLGIIFVNRQKKTN